MAKILKPGDPEYHKALESFTTEDLKLVQQGLKDGAKQVAIPWSKKTLREGYMEYAVIPLTETKCKIVFHFVKLSTRLMEKVSAFFQTKICGPIITVADIKDDVSVEAGQNPLYRSNWDFMVFNYNKFRAPGVMNLIAEALAKEFHV